MTLDRFKKITEKPAGFLIRLIAMILLVPLAVASWQSFTRKSDAEAMAASIAEDQRLQEETTARHSSIPPCKWNSDCDDGNPCSYDHCKWNSDGTNSCTHKFKGVYKGMRFTTCQITLCDHETGKDLVTNMIDGTPCDPGSYILSGHCQEGVCVGDSIVVCNDKNSYTKDIAWTKLCNFVDCTTESYRNDESCGNGGHCHHGICHYSAPPH